MSDKTCPLCFGKGHIYKVDKTGKWTSRVCGLCNGKGTR